MISKKLNLALFDLDHTLLPIDSDYAWGVFTTDIGWTDPHVFRQKNDDFFAHYQAGTLDVHDYLRFATQAVRLQGAASAAAAHARFMREVVQPSLKPQAMALVRQHQTAGDAVVIVTATNEFVTRPIADAFGVPELIAVDLERGPDGWITGEIRGTPSFREERSHGFPNGCPPETWTGTAWTSPSTLTPSTISRCSKERITRLRPIPIHSFVPLPWSVVGAYWTCSPPHPETVPAALQP